jgi:hypothetical protein
MGQGGAILTKKPDTKSLVTLSLVNMYIKYVKRLVSGDFQQPTFLSNNSPLRLCLIFLNIVADSGISAEIICYD